MNVYRGESATSAARIGRGTLGRRNPTAVSASGSIVSIAAPDGDSVKQGDLPLQPLDGRFNGYDMSGREHRATSDGVVAQINLSQGGRLEKGSVAAVLYPEGAMQIQAQIAEANLGLIHEGDPVEIELNWNSDAEVRYTGVISTLDAELIEEEAAEAEAPAEEEDLPEGEFAREGRFAPDGEGLPENPADFSGKAMGGGNGHVQE